MVLITRMIVLNNSFVAAGDFASNRGPCRTLPSPSPRPVLPRRLRGRLAGAGDGDGHRPLRLHADAAADDPRGQRRRGRRRLARRGQLRGLSAGRAHGGAHPADAAAHGLVSLAAIVVVDRGDGLDRIARASGCVLRFVAGVASAWALVSTSVWCLAWLARFERPAGAGMLYAGVGAGIALAGLYCWRAGAAGVRAGRAVAAARRAGAAWACHRRGAADAARLRPPPRSARESGGQRRRPRGARWGLVICYGVLGFGYILPATFLPVLARAVVDDPAVFGAAWPVFGAAAAAFDAARQRGCWRMSRGAACWRAAMR